MPSKNTRKCLKQTTPCKNHNQSRPCTTRNVCPGGGGLSKSSRSRTRMYAKQGAGLVELSPEPRPVKFVEEASYAQATCATREPRVPSPCRTAPWRPRTRSLRRPTFGSSPRPQAAGTENRGKTTKSREQGGPPREMGMEGVCYIQSSAGGAHASLITRGQWEHRTSEQDRAWFSARTNNDPKPGKYVHI